MRLIDDGDALSTNRVAGARRLPPSLAAASNDGVLVLACAGRIVAYDVSEDGLAPRCSIECACPAPALLTVRDGRVACAARGGRVFVAALDDAKAAPAPRGPARAAALAFLSDGLLAAATRYARVGHGDRGGDAEEDGKKPAASLSQSTPTRPCASTIRWWR